MRLSQLRKGMAYGGVTITGLRRRHAYIDITFTDGQTEKTVTLHKEQSFAAVLDGALGSNSLDRRTMERPAHRPRVSDPEWRGEHSGHRGERFIATCESWDRAWKERESRA